jgi:hypothetical protein
MSPRSAASTWKLASGDRSNRFGEPWWELRADGTKLLRRKGGPSAYDGATDQQWRIGKSIDGVSTWT